MAKLRENPALAVADALRKYFRNMYDPDPSVFLTMDQTRAISIIMHRYYKPTDEILFSDAKQGKTLTREDILREFPGEEICSVVLKGANGQQVSVAFDNTRFYFKNVFMIRVKRAPRPEPSDIHVDFVLDNLAQLQVDLGIPFMMMAVRVLFEEQRLSIVEKSVSAEHVWKIKRVFVDDGRKHFNYAARLLPIQEAEYHEEKYRFASIMSCIERCRNYRMFFPKRYFLMQSWSILIGAEHDLVRADAKLRKGERKLAKAAMKLYDEAMLLKIFREMGAVYLIRLVNQLLPNARLPTNIILEMIAIDFFRLWSAAYFRVVRVDFRGVVDEKNQKV